MPPSPTAAAQRLTEPERTSPAAKIPGRLVSSGPGARPAPFHAGASATAGPVLMKPFLVALDLGRQPVGAGLRADHGKDGGRLHRAAFAGLGVFQFDGFEALPAGSSCGSPCARRISMFSFVSTRRER